MKTAIIVDAACDLPEEFCRLNDIHILPLGVAFREHRFLDYRDAETTRSFYLDCGHFRAEEVNTEPPPIELISKFIIEEIADNYDQAFLMCISGHSNRMYHFSMYAGKLAMKLLTRYSTSEYGELSKGSRLTNLRIMDTHTASTGQGLLALEANRLRLSENDLSMQRLYETLRVLSTNIKVLTVPNDLGYVRRRVQSKKHSDFGKLPFKIGDRLDIKPIWSMRNKESCRIGWSKGFEQATEKACMKVTKAINTGLLIHSITASYGGDLREIKKLEAFRELRYQASLKNVKVHLSVMSAAAGIDIGPGALSIAYCN